MIKKQYPIKKSVGIILCRKKNEKYEVLLVNKRYTYAYVEFVLGRYPRGDISKNINSVKYVNILLKGMTHEELLTLLSLDFNSIWYRVWLNCEHNDNYNKKRYKFYNSIMVDGGETFTKLIMSIRQTSKQLLWEVPKGRHNSSKEEDLLCAIREFKEETYIDKKYYRFLPFVTKKVNFISNGTRYLYTYFIAFADNKISQTEHFNILRPQLKDIKHLSETGDIQWFNIEHIRLIDNDKKLEKLLIPAINLVKKFVNNKWNKRN
jgi:8-oxo-dGTP pyrophosphatase MutT (NUDIX family)